MKTEWNKKREIGSQLIFFCFARQLFEEKKNKISRIHCSGGTDVGTLWNI